jgi:hypothetical protein
MRQRRCQFPSHEGKAVDTPSSKRIQIVRQRFFSSSISKQEAGQLLLGTDSTSIVDLGEGMYQLWDSSVAGGGITISIRVVDRGPKGCEINVLGIAHVEGTRSPSLRRLLRWNLDRTMTLCTNELGQVLPGLAEQPTHNGTEPHLG